MMPRWGIASLLALAARLVGLGYRAWRDRPDRDVNRWFALQALGLASWVTGRIDAANAPDGGAAFTVELRLAR